MSDGKWNAQGFSESLIQPLSRHTLLVAELGPAGGVNQFTYQAASYDAALSPLIASAANSGPHFVMSPETPDNAKTLGLEWAIFDPSIKSPAVITGAVAAAGGFTVTIWCMISASQAPTGLVRPFWASMLPETGVAYNSLYHSFDINVHAIRFQIENAVGNTGAVTIAMCEL